jgi:parallel beta-helix repeat protein
MFTHWTAIVLLSILSALAPRICHGGEYFVSVSGNDALDGMSRATAWKSLQHGVSQLKPGDVLTVAPGRYDERLEISNKGTQENPILIRAERPGFSILDASRLVRGFTKTPTSRFVYEVPCPSTVFNVVEADTGEMLRPAPSALDLDQFRSAYYYDRNNGKLYVHCSDGQPANKHVIMVSIRGGFGMDIKGSYVTVDGFGFQGHANPIGKRKHGAAILLNRAKNSTVKHCSFFNNQGAVATKKAMNCVIRDSLFYNNVDLSHAEVAQIYVSFKSKNCSVIDNIVLDGCQHGIRTYGQSRNTRVSGNIVVNNRIGLYFKASSGTNRAFNNVVAGCSYFNFGTGRWNPDRKLEAKNNIYERPSIWQKGYSGPDSTDILFSPEEKAGLFCDPDHLDYRLKKDAKNVFYISPDSREIDKTVAGLKAGDTLYLQPGVYGRGLSVMASGTRKEPIILRTLGRTARAVVPNLALNGNSNIVVEDISINGAFELEPGSSNVSLKRCAILGPLTARGCDDIDIRFSFIQGGDRPAVTLDNACSNVSITSSALVSDGNLILKTGKRQPFQMFNALVSSAQARIDQIVDGRVIVHADSPLMGGGQFRRNIGDCDVREGAVEETISDLQIRQLTPHTASLTFWTPATSSALWRATDWNKPPPVLAKVHYGETRKLGQTVDSFGDLYHRVTVFDLKPATTYHVQVELTGSHVKSPPTTFTTPNADWEPTARVLRVNGRTGSDANSGLSEDQAFKTLTKASEVARAGDTVIVAPGEYHESIIPVATGTPKHPITFKAEKENQTLINGSSYRRPCGVGLIQKAYIVVDGFVFRQFGNTTLGSRAGLHYGQVFVIRSNNVTVKNCVLFGYVSDNQVGAIIQQSDNILFKNNVLIGFINNLTSVDCDHIKLNHNSFYMPAIYHLRMKRNKHLTMQHNIFFSQHESKFRNPFFLINSKKLDSDYNTYVFNHNDTYKYIGGARGKSKGLKGWQQASGAEQNSTELIVRDQFFSQAPSGPTESNPNYMQYWRSYIDRKAVPTLKLFDILTRDLDAGAKSQRNRRR